MGRLAHEQFAQAIIAVDTGDHDLAAKVGSDDEVLDQLERSIADQAVRVLALRSPVADDLRSVITGLKMSGTLERIGDYAGGIARRSLAMGASPSLPSLRALIRMAKLALVQLDDALAAYADGDAAKAEAVWGCDLEVDEQYSGLFRQLLTFMMEDPRTIAASSHLLFIAKNVERIGDLATNICELAYYRVTGHSLGSARPKGDTSSYALGGD